MGMNYCTQEKIIERAACRKIKERFGILSTKIEQTSINGFPDRIFWPPYGSPILIEFKAPGQKPRPSQVKIIKYLRKCGYQVEVCDNVDSAVEIIINALASKGASIRGDQVSY
jgi:hypothetical protein